MGKNRQKSALVVRFGESRKQIQPDHVRASYHVPIPGQPATACM